MKRTIAFIAAMTIASSIQPSSAEEIEILPAEISNLGIATAVPELAHEVTAIKATARVVVPPAGDAIVNAPQRGLLASLNVAVGQDVVRGQVLATLQSPEFIELQREFLNALNTDLLAQSEFDRDRQLFDEGIISGRRLQEARTKASIAAIGLKEHRQLLKIAGLTDAEITALETGQNLLPQLNIRAAIDGVILERMATTGERLDAMSPIYRLADLSLLWLEINVSQEQLASVRPGMRVAVVDSPLPLPAEVTMIGRSIDPATQNIIVRATIAEADHGLYPGQFVAARIVAANIDSSDDTIWTVPVAAVTQRGDSHYVFVRSEAGFDVRTVQVVGNDGNRVSLSADIDANDEIAIVGVATLKVLWSEQGEGST